MSEQAIPVGKVGLPDLRLPPCGLQLLTGNRQPTTGNQQLPTAFCLLPTFMLLVLITIAGCNAQPHPKDLVLGAEQLDLLLPHLQGKRVGLLVNNTATIGKTLLADTLVSRGVNVIKIFGPEHGFRGAAADGELVNDSVDVKTGIPLVSL